VGWGRHPPPPPAAGHLDARLIAFTLGISLFAGCIFAVFVALHAAADAPAIGIREARTPSTLGRSISRRLLVVVQVGLSLMLLIGTGLFVRSLHAVTSIDPGVDIDQLMVLTVDLSRSGYSPDQREGIYAALLRRVGQVPGVERTAMTHFPPFGFGNGIAFSAPGRDTVRVRSGPYLNLAGSGYFATVGLRLLRGRTFTSADATGGLRVAIVNDEMARVLASGGRAIGQCFPLADQALKDEGCTLIVGVVENQRWRYLEDPDIPMVYFPRERNPDFIDWGTPTMMIRIRPGADVPPAQVRAAAQSVGGDLPYVNVQLLSALVEGDVLPFRLGATLCSLFGFIAVTLAAVGLYGVLAFFVTERTLEIGIRRSLGASTSSVLSLVVRQAVLPVGIGVVIGLVAAFGGTRFLRSLLFGVRAHDPISFAAAAALLIAVATIAALVPARRATRVDPAIAMRAE
jgi:predicted permease